MSDQPLDLRRSMRVLRRHKFTVASFAALGLAGGIGLAVMSTPMLTSNALVVLPPTVRNITTQAVIATSDNVLSSALRTVDPGESPQTLRPTIEVKIPTPYILSISAQSKTAAQAERTANAVAKSYITYVKSPHNVGTRIHASIVQPAISATKPSPIKRWGVNGALGLLIGLVIGAIVALAVNRGDRRLRQRDEIANALGVPVLASIAAAHPSDPARWTKLLTEYVPSVVHAWQLRTALSYLGQAVAVSGNESNGSGLSVAVLSLSSDPNALALGPQLAVFAASLGIPTALVIGPAQDPGVTAALRAACAEPQPPPGRPDRLMVAVADHNDMVRPQGARLTVVVGVVDSHTPNVADTMRANITVLGVSAGTATAAQLVGVAVSATTDGRQIEGILVADPDPADHTTGRVPQLTRPAQRRMPTRVTGPSTEIRR